jgi:hypothetical protein
MEQEPKEIYDLKTINTDFYEIYLYNITTQKITNDKLTDIKDFNYYYRVKFLKKISGQVEDNCVCVDSEMEIYLFKEEKKIRKINVLCNFIICLKDDLYEDDSYESDLINYNIFIDEEIIEGIYDILLLNDFPIDYNKKCVYIIKNMKKKI